MTFRIPIFVLSCIGLISIATTGQAQVTTTGFQNLPRAEAPGTLLSHPVANGSEPIGRTTSINYLNGWVIVGGEVPGSRPGSDLILRVYDIANPANPVRRLPSDFGLNYPNNLWIQGNVGWNAHGTAQSGSLLLPGVMRVNGFGGLVELGGTNGIPQLGQLPLWYNRSSQAGPWNATLLWYDTDDSDIEISRQSIGQYGYVERQVLGAFDHVGPFGGGDWHPMFFGDLLIMARSGSSANDGVVVYRLQYQNFEDANRANDSVVPQYVGSLAGGFEGYWPNLFSDATGLYVIGSTSNILVGADISRAVDPSGDGAVTLSASLTVPNFSNASYPVYQDQFGFIHNRKVNMTRFLAGDANPIVLTLDEVGTGVNTSQISLVLGNLWLTGGYPIPGFNQGMGVWVHQQAPDTTPPRVTFHIPQANRTNYPRFAPLSFLLHEHPRNGGPRNGIDFTVRPVLTGGGLGTAVTGFLIHDFSGNLTFTPDVGLAADTTYQVNFHSDPANQIGFVDAAGNYIEPYTFRFSTGGGINAIAPPVFTSLTADIYQPAPGQLVTVTAAATGTGALDYRFNFNGTWSAWNATTTANHTYLAAGRPRVLAQVRDSAGSVVTTSLSLLVITPPAAGPRPTHNSTMAIGEDPDGRRLWSVNPDANTVTVINPATGAKVAEHAVGSNPRSIARDALGRYWVTCLESDEIRVLNANGTTHTTIPLNYGAAPFGIAASPDGQQLFVTLYGSGHIHRYSAASPGVAPTIRSTFTTPRAIAVSADGQRVLVTRFISPELEAEVAEFAGVSTNLDLIRTIRLASASTIDGGDRSAGVPNYLSSIAISPDGSRAVVASKQDNTLRGTLFGVGDLTHETTVRAVVSLIDLASNEEIRHSRRDFDNSDSPSAVAFTPLGDTLLVALQGSNRLVGMDALNLAPVTGHNAVGSVESSPAVITLDAGTGLAPQGVLVDAVSQRIFTQNFMGRSVSVRNATPLLVENRTNIPLIATTASVSNELLSSPVLAGKRIFYNAADPRMSADGYISCASCHVDGGHDGRIWDFSGRGEGLRRTTDLRGRSGIGHGNVHWSGNFDEIQDFEHDMRGPFGGTGFLGLTPAQFAGQHPSPASGKTGLNADLDALAAYVTSLTPAHTPRSPTRNSNGTMTAAAVRGRDVFVAQNCASCHSGDALTGSTLTPINAHPLVNIGTQSALSGSRLAQPITGIDTPTLHGLHAARSLLHHGQATTLDDVFNYTGGTFISAAQGQPLTTVNANAVNIFTDNAFEGGGGFLRGPYGAVASLGDEAGAATPPGIRFNNIDGGPSGGTGRIAMRYVRQYNNGTALLRVNGVQQTLNVLRQYPDNSWQTSGWRWITVDVPLNAGTGNTIDVLRGNGNLQLNALIVSNAADITATQPHRLVQSLSTGDRTDLLAYLRQVDGRDAVGAPFPPPNPPAPQAPGIVSAPTPRLLAVGNRLHFVVAVSGTAPFSYQWYRDATLVGLNSPELEIASVQSGDAGMYRVEVTNGQNSISTQAVEVIINPALLITTASLPTAPVEWTYNQTLTAIGGVSTRTWTLQSGNLPAGLVLSTDGQITGIPTSPGRAEFTVRVSDSSGSATRAFTMNAPPVGGFVNDPDLILHYTFDEGIGTRIWDSAPSGLNHATNHASPQWAAGGRFGGAYGSADLSASISSFFPANQSDLDFDPRGNAFTISVWVRTAAPSGYNTILGKDRGVAPWESQFRMWMNGSPNGLQAVNGNQYSGTLATTSPALNNGQWQLVTLVNYLDGVTWRSRLYYNNGTGFTQFNTGAGGRLPGLMRVGDTTQGGNAWRGQIDDLRIYQRALSQAEIATLFNAPQIETFGGWLNTHLTPAQQQDPALTGSAGDANRNGVPNLIEFVTGSSTGMPLTFQLNGNPGVGTVTLTLSRNTLARGVTLIVESSEDLLEWTPLATSLNGAAPTGTATISEGTGVVRTLTVVVPSGETRSFYRTRAVRTP